jgi:multiple antibiotic resistance protein
MVFMMQNCVTGVSMNEFLLCFIPIFVAVDPVGNLPIFMTLTHGMGRLTLRRVIIQSIATAMIVSLAFLAAGRIILGYLGVTVGDFAIAGGILLFIFSICDLLSLGEKADSGNVGAVPIGVPLLAGPAMLTTMILLAGTHGAVLTAAATVLTLGITGVVFLLSRKIYGTLGKNGSQIISKLSNLLLAAIGVMMVRKGILMILAEMR